MNCKNCNTTLPENQTKCPNCGTENIPETQVQTEPEYISAAGAERAVPKGFSSKKNIIIIIIAAIVLIIGGVTAVAVTTNGFDFTGIRTTLQLADRYLSEQNYEQAIIEFEKVLEIEPMNVDAYLGLANAYMALGEMDKAVKVLEEGIEKTDSDRLRDRLEGIRESLKPVTTEAEVTTVPGTEGTVVTVAPGETTEDVINVAETVAVKTEAVETETATTAETKPVTTVAETKPIVTTTTKNEPVVTEPPIEGTATSTVDVNDETPFKQKYWVIFTEGFRNNRVEASTINSSLLADKLTIIWDSALELNNTSGSDSCDQYYLDENNNWVYIGSYHRLTDYATNVIASNLDVVDRDGNVIVSKSLYSTISWDEINRYR